METFTIPLTEQGDVTLTAYLQMQSPYLEALRYPAGRADLSRRRLPGAL